MKITIDFRMHNASGIGTYITNIVPYLVKKHDVTLLIHKTTLIDANFNDKVKIINMKSSIYSIGEQFELMYKIKKCDVFWSPHYNVPVLPIRASYRIVTIHDVYHLAFLGELSLLKRIYAKFILQRAVRLSKHILTVSSFSEKEINKYLNPKFSIEIVPCSVDKHMFNSKGILQLRKKFLNKKYTLPAKFLLFVGNVKPHKNLITLVEALRELPKYSLVIVGKEEGFITGDSALSSMIECNKSLKDRIIFTGYVENEDLPDLYKMAEIFVFPSLYEGFGIPPLEAQACGCPVISSKSASLPEVLLDSVIYFDATSSNSIKTAIEEVYSSAEIKNILIEKGFNNVKRYEWEVSAEAINQVIEGIK